MNVQYETENSAEYEVGSEQEFSPSFNPSFKHSETLNRNTFLKAS